ETAVASSSANWAKRSSASAGGWSSPLQLAAIMPQGAPSTTIGAPTVALTSSRRSTLAMLPLPSSAKLSRAERPVRTIRAFTLSPSSEPIPDGDRDSTAWQQFWIWFGANVIPTSWVVGAIGPQLGLSLVQSIVIMVVGQAAGTLIFGLFTLMGKRTGVSQFALGRMAFGRRGNN